MATQAIIKKAVHSAEQAMKLRGEKRALRKEVSMLTKALAKKHKADDKFNDEQSPETQLHIPNVARYQHLPMSSVISIGLRRALTNCAAADLSKVLMLDVSRQRVCNSEVLAANLLILACRRYHEHIFGRLGVRTDACKCKALLYSSC